MKTLIYLLLIVITIIFTISTTLLYKKENTPQLQLKNGYVFFIPNYNLCLIHADAINISNKIIIDTKVKFTIKHNGIEYVFNDTITDSIMPGTTKTLIHLFKVKDTNIDSVYGTGTTTIFNWKTK